MSVNTPNSEQFDSLKKEFLSHTDDDDKEIFILSLFDNLVPYLQQLDLSESDIEIFFKNIRPSLEHISTHNAYVNDPDKKSMLSKAKKKIYADLIDTQISLITILQEENQKTSEKMEKFNRTLDGFQDRMLAYQNKPGVGKKICVDACRVLGAIAGLLLIPAVPFVMAYSEFAKARNDSSLGQALLEGFKGFVWGLLYSPIIAVKQAVGLVNETSLVKSMEADEELAQPTELPAKKARTMEFFRISRVNTQTEAAAESHTGNAVSLEEKNPSPSMTA